MNDFWKTGFKAEDFGGLSEEFWFPEVLERANEILFAELKKAKTVYGLILSNGQHSWQDVLAGPQTHTAKLVAVEEMK